MEASWKPPVNVHSGKLLHEKSAMTKGTTVLVVGGKYEGQHGEVISAATKTCVLKMGQVVTGNIKRQMLQTLEPAQQSASRCPDWSSLPVVVLCLIFNFLHELAYIARCRRVCTSWRDAVPYADPLRHIVVHAAFKTCTEHGREGQHGNFTDLTRVDGVGSTCCRHSIILPTPKFLKAAVLRPMNMIIGKGFVWRHTSHVVLSMRSLTPSAAATLSKLTIAVVITGACVRALAKMCTGLQVLSVRVVSLSLEDVSNVNHQWRHLRELTLTCTGPAGSTYDVEVAAIELLVRLPRLISFHIDSTTTIVLFALNSESLREAYVSGKGFTVGSINAPNLEIFDTSGSYPYIPQSCTESLPVDLINNCPNLRLVQGFDVRLEEDVPDPISLRSRAIVSAVVFHLRYLTDKHDPSVLWCKDETCNNDECLYRHRY